MRSLVKEEQTNSWKELFGGGIFWRWDHFLWASDWWHGLFWWACGSCPGHNSHGGPASLTDKLYLCDLFSFLCQSPNQSKDRITLSIVMVTLVRAIVKGTCTNSVPRSRIYLMFNIGEFKSIHNLVSKITWCGFIKYFI